MTSKKAAKAADVIVGPEAARRIADLVAGQAANDSVAPVAGAAPTGGGMNGRDENGPAPPREGGFSVDRMNREWGLVLMGSKAVIVREQIAGPMEDRLRLIAVDAFKTWFANTYTEVVGSDGKVKGMTWALRWIQSYRRRQFAGIEFFPNPDGVPGTEGYLNLWRGFAVEPRQKKDGWDILHDHLLNNVCDGDAALYGWVLGWFAHMVQRPRERIGTALVMRGKMGTGKTKVGEVMGSLFPAHYFAVDDPRYVTGQFNAHMASCILLQAEEAVWAGDKAAEGRLKGLVTSKFQMIEAKGIDPIRLDNLVRLMMTSNEDWVVPAGKDERRFCVLDINPRCAQNTDYFREMDEELANGGLEALLYDLMHYDLSCVDLRKIPRTGALLEQKVRSLDSVESWWFERLSTGVTTAGVDQWLIQVPREALYKDYLGHCDAVGVKRRCTNEELAIKLRKLVPRLDSVRPRGGSDGEQKRVRCYILPSLEDCREAFDEELGQSVRWPESGEG
ncbi:primase-helicase family protein [Xanthobacter autotrophicus]|uniref:primase-helicase family protein n=1 Tax=Xanthobacter autotrophicus TaxID=280 RepID=UPI00372AA076